MEDKLEKRKGGLLGERSQYALTFVVIASMLYVAQFPLLVIFFFGIFAYLLWKAFAGPSGQGVKEIFDFYISANEILRDDERRWFGFEVREVINQGESITRTMSGAPPLVFFALGALYNKSGDHHEAVEHLEFVIDDERSNEGTYMHPSRELRRYVKLLRKIEREPVEAPQISAAVRSLERKRKNRIHSILEDSRAKIEADKERRMLEAESSERRNGEPEIPSPAPELFGEERRQVGKDVQESQNGDERTSKERQDRHDSETARKPISEVLHDIYDKNIQ